MESILRVFARRNFKSSYHPNSKVKVQFIITNEDNSYVHLSHLPLTFEIIFKVGEEEEESKLFLTQEDHNLSCVFKEEEKNKNNNNNGVYDISFQLPSLSSLSSSSSSSSSFQIFTSSPSCPDVLPFLSDYIQIVPSSSSLKPSNLTLFTCYRKLSCHVNNNNITEKKYLYIKENYGLTLGSHIWDASIVLSQYLLTLPKEISGTVLELGAGCGVVGLSLGLTLSPHNLMTGLLTDVSSQLPLLKENIQINKLNHCCTTQEMDIFSSSSSSSFQSSSSSSSSSSSFQSSSSSSSSSSSFLSSDLNIFDYIVGADILYNKDGHDSLMQVIIRNMGYHTTVYLAQKERRAGLLNKEEAYKGWERDDWFEEQYPQLKRERLYEHCGVVIWKLVHRSYCDLN